MTTTRNAAPTYTDDPARDLRDQLVDGRATLCRMVDGLKQPPGLVRVGAGVFIIHELLRSLEAIDEEVTRAAPNGGRGTQDQLTDLTPVDEGPADLCRLPGPTRVPRDRDARRGARDLGR